MESKTTLLKCTSKNSTNTETFFKHMNTMIFGLRLGKIPLLGENPRKRKFYLKKNTQKIFQQHRKIISSLTNKFIHTKPTTKIPQNLCN